VAAGGEGTGEGEHAPLRASSGEPREEQRQVSPIGDHVGSLSRYDAEPARDPSLR
jgi:hypothetical protein